MRRLGVLGAIVVSGLLALGLTGPPASATVLCKTAGSPCTGGTYGKGTTVEASLKSGTKFALTTGFGEIRCSESTIKGEVTNAGGEATNVAIAITSFSLGECNCGSKVLTNGSWSVESSGKVVSSGTETTFECLETHCIFKTNNTPIGTLKGGEMASITMEASLPRTGGRSGALCEVTGALQAEYTVTKPEPLYVEEPSISTVLCKTATNPCTGSSAYGKGTTIEGNLKSGTESVLKSKSGEVKCSESLIKGEVTNAGGEGAKVSGSVSSLSFGKCNGGVTVLKPGTFTIESPSEGSGTLTLEGYETTTELVGFHCIFSGSVSVPLKGGEMASVATGGVTLSRTGGRSGAFCGTTGAWTAEYTVTKPEPLYVEEPSISTVLCKTATNPCTGSSAYGKGTTIEASLKSGTKSVLHPLIGDIECTGSTIKGEVTSPGSEGAVVSGSLSTFSFSGCNATVSVLKKGTFAIKHTSEGNGTLTLEGFETTVEFAGFHCIYSGTVSFTLKGGEMALTSGPSNLKRTAGRSENFCGKEAAWTAEYTVTTPEPLYVEEP